MRPAVENHLVTPALNPALTRERVIIDWQRYSPAVDGPILACDKSPMAEALIFEKVWQMFQETDRKFQETDRKFQETDRKFQETDRIVKETAEQMKETDRRLQETDRQLQELGRRFGDLGNRLGEFVEEMVKPACVRLFRERGIEVREVHSRTLLTDGSRRMELDMLVVNDAEVVAVECKSRLTVEAVERHLRRLGEMKKLAPKYERMTIYGAVAAMVMDEDARELAEERGLFVLGQTGETVAVLNREGFVPAAF